jgi:hypothetical protein
VRLHVGDEAGIWRRQVRRDQRGDARGVELGG